MACGSLSAASDPTLPSSTGTQTTPGGGACPPLDAADDDPTLGDSCAEAVDPLGDALDDSGAAPISITGNLHQAGDVDWYRITTLDLGGDETRGYEDFHLQIRVLSGSVEFTATQDDCANSAECTAGYDEFSFFSEDLEPDETGWIPDDSRACGPGLNECPDYSSTWLLKVFSPQGQPSCDPYTIEVSNGIW